MLIYENSKNVKELKPKDFKVSKLNSSTVPILKRPTLVKYYAHWCPHCTDPEMHDFIEALAETLPVKANIDVNAFSCENSPEHQEIAQNIGIQGYPTLIYYNKDGKSHEYRGPRDIKTILEFLLEHS